MIAKYMPFWMLDIIKTEERLSKLAAEGKILTGFKKSGKFIFENDEPAKLKFRIVKEKKCGGEMPQRLSEKGWSKAAGCKNYYIAYTNKSSEEIGPSYKSWITHYRTLQSILILCIGFVLGMTIGAGAANLENLAEGKARWITAIIPLIFSALFIGLFCRAHKSNKKLLTINPESVKFNFTIPEENFIYTKEQEKAMLKSKQMIKKSPFFWIGAPDKAEAMVEKMAAEGWKFYRLSKMGDTFYFIKSEPCKLRFVVDFQEEVSEDYITLTKEEGWKLEFASISKKDSYCIWSKVYGDDEDAPEIYSDNDSALTHAKKYLTKMIIPMAICAVFSIFLIFLCFTDGLGITPFKIGYIFFMTIITVEYSVFAVKSIGYYLRQKKKSNEI